MCSAKNTNDIPPAGTAIIINDLVLFARIGILPQEQQNTQRICVNVRVELQDMPNDLKDSICYASIIDHVKTLTERHIDLVETYAHTIATFCMETPSVAAAIVKVEKMDIIEESKGVGAEVSLYR